MATPETFESDPFVAGGVSTAELGRFVPTKLGLSAPQLPLPNQPGSGALISIESAAVRPKVGLPQIASVSLVWRGPLMLSLLVNTITSQ